MKKFTHLNATSVNQASSLLAEHQGKAEAIAGGTDLLGELIYRSQPSQPEYIINLKTISGLDYIREEGGNLKIGANTRLHDIAANGVVTSKYPALAKAAHLVASWQIRNMGTIAGNICQENRCMYLRSSWNKFNCLKKNSGGLCYALAGTNTYHSVFGAASGCVAVNPSDTAPVLVALDAKIKTNKRTIDAGDFFAVKVAPAKPGNTVLEDDEIVTEIEIPAPPAGSKQAFVKIMHRRAIDFALASAAVLVTPATGNVTSARIVLNGVSPNPRRATAAETALVGKTISATVADEVANAAIQGSLALQNNRYKLQLIKAAVKKALLA